MANWKFYIETYGCKVNQYESQALRDAWKRQGGIETAQPSHADYILVNSCAITARAERNARNAIFRLKKSAPGAKLILCGCAAQFYADFKPRKKANHALPDVLIPQNEKSGLLNGPEQAAPAAGPLFGITDYTRSRPVIKIQDGCSQKCSYCIVPQTRREPASREREEIVAECRALAQNGFGELVLSGVNLRQYHHKGDFWDLLAWLEKELAPEFGASLRLRVSSIDPAMLDARALDILAGCKLVCPHLHLSLQHASPAILKAMRRSHYEPENLLDIIDQLGQIWPIKGLGADIITGFPGETEEDFGLLLDFLSECPLTYAHVFPFSARQGTTAAAMGNQIAKKEKEERAWQARAIITQKQEAFWKSQLAIATMRIAAGACRENHAWRGYNDYYVPCEIRDKTDRGVGKGLFYAQPAGICPEGVLVSPKGASGTPFA